MQLPSMKQQNACNETNLAKNIELIFHSFRGKVDKSL